MNLNKHELQKYLHLTVRLKFKNQMGKYNIMVGVIHKIYFGAIIFLPLEVTKDYEMIIRTKNIKLIGKPKLY